MMEGELNTVRHMLSEEQHRNADFSQKAQQAVAESQSQQGKFKKLTDMYTAMRNEHLELLKQKQQFAQGRTQLSDAKQAYEKLQRVRRTFPLCFPSLFSFSHTALNIVCLVLFLSFFLGKGSRSWRPQEGDRSTPISTE